MNPKEKTGERAKVEAAMREHCIGVALTAGRIAELAGVNQNTTRYYLHKIVQAGNAHNIGSRSDSRYQWGSGYIARDEVNTPREAPEANWTPPKWEPSRPGCMDAFDHGSIENGEWRPRTRPALIGSQPGAAVGVHGGRVPT